MTIDTFTEQFRLEIARDECGDKMIPGKRGHLYFAGGELCLIAINCAVVARRKWQALGGKLWLGDISPNTRGHRVHDVKIENALAAIAMAQCRQKRILSAEEREALLARLRK